ncbi:hypothetical protein ACTXT7_000106 [Hymenolepis weldensis]
MILAAHYTTTIVTQIQKEEYSHVLFSLFPLPPPHALTPRKIQNKVPSVHKTLKRANVDCIVLATKWFICLFADVLPIESEAKALRCTEVSFGSLVLLTHILASFLCIRLSSVGSLHHQLCTDPAITGVTDTVLRIFDSLFYEGDKILFRACIALTKLHTKEILYCQQFPDVVLTFRDITQDKQTLYCHEFLKAMFKLPGSLPRSLIRKLRAKCLVQVKATLEDLEAQKRDYCERMARQQEESHYQENQQALTSDEEDTKNPDKEVDEDSYSEEFEDNSDEENGDQILKSPRQKDSADDIESSPSLNIITANHDNGTL